MANEVTIHKRKRSANWDETEKNLLRECLKDVLDIIENKCVDTNTNKAKTLTWKKVLKCFNEVNNRERGLTELKQQWRTMKMDAKRCNSNYKKALKATGGGMKPPSPDPQTAEIMEMLPQEFEEDINEFDSDTITQNKTMPGIEVPSQINDDIIIEMKEQNTINQEFKIDEDVTLPQKSTPVSKGLLTCKRDVLESMRSSKRKLCRMEGESESATNRNVAVIKFMEAEHKLKMQQMVEAHTWAQEEFKLRCENLKLQNLLLQKQMTKNE